ncbi:MAG TPA: hypothetical protein VEY91_01815, partial [Candidatus Limnocylindria bacterium]|nr:hypothetical protein [Candidatus Limnocylindria bacterium]
SGLAIGLAALLLGLLSAAIGSWWQRSLPLRNCSNCGDPVCRRCSERQREVALCPACARAAARAQNPEFGRILLHQHRRRVERRQRLVRTALATLLPGYGLLALRRVFGPLALLVSAAALVVHALGLGAPFAFEPRLGFMETKPSNVLAVLPWVAIFAFSLMGYFSRLARAPVLDTSPVRSRVAPISRMTAKAA